tara:strand:+ start:1167 stop:1286 length:120 start_codon:yes stop_codon:yes gene_type:complete
MGDLRISFATAVQIIAQENTGKASKNWNIPKHDWQASKL